VVDILLLAEIAWCTLLLRMKGVYAATLLAGGIFTSGYVAYHLSGWIAKQFLPPVSPAFRWLENHLSYEAQSVSTLSAFLPPIPTTNGFQHSQWIALHLVRTFLFVAITGAVFGLFVVMNYLSDALWDRPNHRASPVSETLTTCLSFSCGVYAAGMTVVLLANLSWIQDFSVMTPELANSIGIQAVSKVANMLQGWVIP
jgi:hypothetical protein